MHTIHLQLSQVVCVLVGTVSIIAGQSLLLALMGCKVVQETLSSLARVSNKRACNRLLARHGMHSQATDNVWLSLQHETQPGAICYMLPRSCPGVPCVHHPGWETHRVLLPTERHWVFTHRMG